MRFDLNRQEASQSSENVILYASFSPAGSTRLATTTLGESSPDCATFAMWNASPNGYSACRIFGNRVKEAFPSLRCCAQPAKSFWSFRLDAFTEYTSITKSSVLVYCSLAIARPNNSSGPNNIFQTRLIGFVLSFLGTKIFIDLAIRNRTVVFCG